MSLSSFLLGGGAAGDIKSAKGKAIDKGLDDIFRSAVVAAPKLPNANESQPVEAAAPSTSTHVEKRKHIESTEPVKRKKVKFGKEHKSESKQEPEAEQSPKKSHSKKRSKASKGSGDKEANPEPEERTEDRVQSPKKSRDSTVTEAANESDSDEEGDPSKLVHESLLKDKGGNNGNKGKSKFIPPEETPELRRARTIFVGNVPVDVVKSRPLQKQLKRHIISFLPTAKIESIRFRSVAFKNPTTKLPPLDGSVDKAQAAAAAKEKEKDGRQHDRERAASWRATKGAEPEDQAKTYLTPNSKKRIAFIKQEIHEGVDAVNAYVVFAHPPPPVARAANLPPPAPVMDPFEAAKKAVELCDGSVFMERTLRVDLDGKNVEPGAKDASSSVLGDPRTTIFVGNLDFASKEEDLRVFFEGLVSAERGPPSEETGDADEDEDAEEDEEEEHGQAKGTKISKPRTWVKRVRIIRDKDTQLGKGFAYVQFVDRQCVDEILALEPTRVKFAKRKLRVQRCKVIPNAAASSSKPPKSRAPPSASAKSPAHNKPYIDLRAPLPKGNPELGTKIQHLPKEERKKVKATDADRVARRMAKKKAKVLAEKGVKSKVDRKRVRKRVGEKGSAGPKKEKAKRRVRSDKALSKLNTKKS